MILRRIDTGDPATTTARTRPVIATARDRPVDVTLGDIQTCRPTDLPPIVIMTTMSVMANVPEAGSSGIAVQGNARLELARGDANEQGTT
jgi:hypothetical protein